MNRTCKKYGHPVQMVRFCVQVLYLKVITYKVVKAFLPICLPGDLPKYQENIKRNMLTLWSDIGPAILKVIINTKEIIFLRIFTSRAVTINKRHISVTRL